MAAMFETLRGSIDRYIAAFPPVERQVGAIVYVSGRLAGPRTLRRARHVAEAVGEGASQLRARRHRPSSRQSAQATRRRRDGLQRPGDVDGRIDVCGGGRGRRRPSDKSHHCRSGVGGTRPRDSRQRLSSERCFCARGRPAHVGRTFIAPSCQISSRSRPTMMGPRKLCARGVDPHRVSDRGILRRHEMRKYQRLDTGGRGDFADVLDRCVMPDDAGFQRWRVRDVSDQPIDCRGKHRFVDQDICAVCQAHQRVRLPGVARR